MILGIAQDLEGLIGKHPSIQRSIVGIHLSLMQRSSLRTLISLGEKAAGIRSEEHTSELQSLMRTSYAVFCLKKKTPPHVPSSKPYLSPLLQSLFIFSPV